jgi:hypothetical protein
VTDDRLLFKAFGILTLKSQLLQNHRLTADSKSVVSTEFFKRLVFILHDFCIEIVRCGSSFHQSIFLCEYSKLNKYPDDDHLSFFHTSDEENHLTMGSEIT